LKRANQKAKIKRKTTCKSKEGKNHVSRSARVSTEVLLIILLAHLDHYFIGGDKQDIEFLSVRTVAVGNVYLVLVARSNAGAVPATASARSALLGLV
jgi:hypothetical protein